MRTTTHTPHKHGIRSFLRYAWDDTVKANRAMFRLPPYDDYLQNHRDTHR
jgi:uncharacterized short protein YbdD (DUF466 family)